MLQTTVSGTLSLFHSDKRSFLLSSANAVLKRSKAGLELSLPDSLAHHATRIYLRKGSWLCDNDFDGDCCLVEIDPDSIRKHALLKSRTAAPLPKKLATVSTPMAVAGVSAYGECYGFVQPPRLPRDVMLMQGVASPGNSGTALYSQDGLVGVCAGFVQDSTVFPDSISTVNDYSSAIVRAFDRKRYVVVPALDESAVSAAPCLSTTSLLFFSLSALCRVP